MASNSLARSALLKMSKSTQLAGFVMKSRFGRHAVKRFMPGEELSDALAASQSLAADRLGTIVTRLGENLASPEEADAVREHYLSVLSEIAARKLDSHISVKPTQLGLDFSFDRCAGHLEALAEKAEATGTIFWIDMEDSSYVDRTLDLYRRLKAKYPRVGLAIQAYLRRTPADLASLVPLRPIIRLVKGAYAEPAHLAFPAKRDTDLAYYDLASELLGHAAKGQALPIFGTHDLPLVERIITKAGSLGVKDDGYEIHMLYGIRMGEQKALAARGRTVKTLISYGSSWFPWYMRRLAERPANVWFVARSLLSPS
jgi:proline dehydrogenase